MHETAGRASKTDTKHKAMQSDAKCTRLQGEHQKYEGMHEAAGRASKKCNKASKSN